MLELKETWSAFIFTDLFMFSAVLYFIGKHFVSVFIEIKFIIISSSLINRVKVISF